MSFGLSALALDDVWHRIFGQDVTLWSPTHFVFLFGGMLTVTGMLVLLKEGSLARAPQNARSATPAGRSWPSSPGGALQRVALLGGLLCGLELYLAEYDWGVPLYRQVWQPLLLAAFAGLIFTAARAWAGPGQRARRVGRLRAHPRDGHPRAGHRRRVARPSMPLLLGSPRSASSCSRCGSTRRRRDARLRGRWRASCCGTVGFAAEYGWSQIAMPLPWTGALLPEGLIYAALAGVARRAARARSSPPRCAATCRRPRVARVACIGAFALLIAVAIGAADKHVPDARAQIELTDVKSAPRPRGARHRPARPARRRRRRELALHPRLGRAATTAWSTGSSAIGPGVYRSTKPIPLGGTWKVGLRLNRGRERGAVPMRLPVDRGLPNAEQTLPALHHGRRARARDARVGRRRAARARLVQPARSATTT